MEVFAKPAVGAIIEKREGGRRFLLLQERQKENGGCENGLTEIPAGKIREYESIFSALRREVFEETGLTVTKIQGEEQTVTSTVNGYRTVSFSPFFTTQNLSGGYSLLLNTFLCEAEGEPLSSSNETVRVRFEAAEQVKALLDSEPQRFFPMHINALRKYFTLFPVAEDVSRRSLK